MARLTPGDLFGEALLLRAGGGDRGGGGDDSDGPLPLHLHGHHHRRPGSSSSVGSAAGARGAAPLPSTVVCETRCEFLVVGKAQLDACQFGDPEADAAGGGGPAAGPLLDDAARARVAACAVRYPSRAKLVQLALDKRAWAKKKDRVIRNFVAGKL